MDSRIKHYLLVALLAITMFGSQLACDETIDSTRDIVGDIGCADTAARDACGGDTHCRIAACQK